MNALLGKLDGIKTYIVGAAAILTAIGAFLNHAIDLKTMVESIFAAVGAMTIRHGITTSVNAVASK